MKKNCYLFIIFTFILGLGINNFLENFNNKIDLKNKSENNLIIDYSTFKDFDLIKEKKYDKVEVFNIIEGNSFFGKTIFNLDTKSLVLHLNYTNETFFNNVGDFKGDNLQIFAKKSFGEKTIINLQNWNGNFLYVEKISSSYDLDEEGNIIPVKITSQEAEELAKLNIKYIEIFPNNLSIEVKNILLKNEKITWSPDVYN